MTPGWLFVLIVGMICWNGYRLECRVEKLEKKLKERGNG